MRIYLFLLFAIAATGASAATVPSFCAGRDTFGYGETCTAYETGNGDMFVGAICTSAQYHEEHRVDIVAVKAKGLSNGNPNVDYANLSSNTRCYCRITYPALSAWRIVESGGGGAPVPTSYYDIGCATYCLGFLSNISDWSFTSLN